MNQQKLNPSEAELMASVADAWKKALLDDFDKVEKGFYTANEICKMIGCKKTKTRHYLKKKMSEGKCECKKFKVNINGNMHIIPHYRIL